VSLSKGPKKDTAEIVTFKVKVSAKGGSGEESGQRGSESPCATLRCHRKHAKLNSRKADQETQKKDNKCKNTHTRAGRAFVPVGFFLLFYPDTMMRGGFQRPASPSEDLHEGPRSAPSGTTANKPGLDGMDCFS
jgi:hypothetical protein